MLESEPPERDPKKLALESDSNQEDSVSVSGRSEDFSDRQVIKQHAPHQVPTVARYRANESSESLIHVTRKNPQ